VRETSLIFEREVFPFRKKSSFLPKVFFLQRGNAVLINAQGQKKVSPSKDPYYRKKGRPVSDRRQKNNQEKDVSCLPWKQSSKKREFRSWPRRKKGITPKETNPNSRAGKIVWRKKGVDSLRTKVGHDRTNRSRRPDRGILLSSE